MIFSLTLISFSSAFAVPNLQLFVAGGSYDEVSESWVTTDGTFQIYVIGANEALSNVRVSMALGYAESFDPNGTVSVDVNGTTYDQWLYGHAPLESAPGFDPGDDLSPHGVYPSAVSAMSSRNPITGIHRLTVIFPVRIRSASIRSLILPSQERLLFILMHTP